MHMFFFISTETVLHWFSNFHLFQEDLASFKENFSPKWNSARRKVTDISAVLFGVDSTRQL